MPIGEASAAPAVEARIITRTAATTPTANELVGDGRITAATADSSTVTATTGRTPRSPALLMASGYSRAATGAVTGAASSATTLAPPLVDCLPTSTKPRRVWKASEPGFGGSTLTSHSTSSAPT